MIKCLTLLSLAFMINYGCFSQQRKPVGSMREAVVELEKNFFKERFKSQLDTFSIKSFIDRYQYLMAYYAREEWGVLGGQELYRDYYHKVEPQNLGTFLSIGYYHMNVKKVESARSLMMSVSDTIQLLPHKNPRIQKWKFKVRDGLMLDNIQFYIKEIESARQVDDDFIGILFKPDLNAGIISLKGLRLQDELSKYLATEIPKTNSRIPTKMILNQMYGEISVTGGSKPKMAAVLNLILETDELKQNYNKHLTKELGFTYTGAELNKLFEELLSEIFRDFNNRLLSKKSD